MTLKIKQLKADGGLGAIPIISDSAILWSNTTSEPINISGVSFTNSSSSSSSVSNGLVCSNNTININSNGITVATLDEGKVSINVTGALTLPNGLTTQRPETSITGDIRYNSSNNIVEAYHSDGWKSLTPAPYNGFRYFTVETSTYFISDNDYCVGVNYNDYVSIYLPSGITGMNFIIKDESGRAIVNNITIYPSSGQLIDGNESYAILGNYNSVSVYFGKTSWYVI